MFTRRALQLMTSYIGRLWRGEIALWVTYWVWGVIGSLLVALAITPMPIGIRFSMRLFLALLMLAYYVLIFVAVWRSAGRYPGRRIWAKLARGVLLMGLVQGLRDVFGGR